MRIIITINLFADIKEVGNTSNSGYHAPSKKMPVLAF